jgi:GDP-D-mannose dehydratase
MRPEELPYLRGDASKIKDTLSWKPEITFDELIEEMLLFWDKKIVSSL